MNRPSTEQLKAVANEYDYMLYLDSNGYADQYGRWNHLLMASNNLPIECQEGTSEAWLAFKNELDTQQHSSILPVFFSYDLKNSFENLTSQHPALSGFPFAGAFLPELLFGHQRNGESIQIGTLPSDIRIDENENRLQNFHVTPDTSREDYKEQFQKIREHLKRGDIYETNYCIRFSANIPHLDPIKLFERLNAQSPSPFASLLKWKNAWLIGSSPERFITRNADIVISQPIKGTARRTGDLETDRATIEKLKVDPKERAENIMITDLVRNDLSHFALPGSVEVKELCGIYPYNRVFQMISTVEARIEPDLKNCSLIETAFPMGSMTGVPKIRAMEIADETETFRRELYSGSVGYFDGSDRCDLNVVIRSFLWNADSGLLSFSTGGAITIRSDADQEYDECLLKAEALLQCLKELNK
jgi:para-aminobenzoate synthetase component 1